MIPVGALQINTNSIFMQAAVTNNLLFPEATQGKSISGPTAGLIS